MQELISNISSYLAGQTDVMTAYLFGSFARGRARHDSDVDIAILYFMPMTDKMARFERRLELEISLEKLLRRPVQVVDMETASPLLQHQVRKYGKLILDRDKRRRVNFEVRSRRQYFDMQRFYRVRYEAALRRLGD